MEVKIFTKILKPKQGFWPGSAAPNVGDIEAEINLWLAAHPNIQVTNITQSQSGGSWMPATIVFSVWYKNNN